MSGSLSKLDSAQVLRAAFDDEKQRLKVDAQVTAQIPSMDIALSAAHGDSVSIADETGQNSLHINSDGSINVDVQNINIDHINDSMRIGDGVNLTTTTKVSNKTGLDVNLLNANLTTNSKQIPVGPTQLVYGTINNININSSGTIINYTVPAGLGFYLQKAYISSNQNSTYTLYVNGNTLIRTRMAYTQFSQTVDLNTSSSFGILINAGDVVTIDATNNGTGLGTFDATIQLMELL